MLALISVLLCSEATANKQESLHQAFAYMLMHLSLFYVHETGTYCGTGTETKPLLQMAEAVAVHRIAKAKKASVAPPQAHFVHATANQKHCWPRVPNFSCSRSALLGTDRQPHSKIKMILRSVGDVKGYIHYLYSLLERTHFMHTT